MMSTKKTTIAEEELSRLDNAITSFKNLGRKPDVMTFVEEIKKTIGYDGSEILLYTKEGNTAWKQSLKSPWTCVSIEDINVPHDGMLRVDVRYEKTGERFALHINTRRVLTHFTFGPHMCYIERPYDTVNEHREVKVALLNADSLEQFVKKYV